MKKIFTSGFTKATILAAMISFLLIHDSVCAQTRAGYFVTYNSSTASFPVSAAGVQSGVVTSATVNYSGLTTGNDSRCVCSNPNASTTLNTGTAPYLSYTFNFASANITLDRFVMCGLAEFASTTLQLRWSVDNYASSLGQFTINGSSYTLSSVSLSSFGSIAVSGPLIFRVYFYNASGEVFNSDTGPYSSLDGTPASYGAFGQNVALWYTSITLPLTWTSFTAQKQNDDVLLEWSTASEQNTKEFTVQHSGDGQNWVNEDSVTSAGNSSTTRNYTDLDKYPVNGINFYRILEVDLDGNINYSKIATVNFSGGTTGIKLLENPVTTGMLQFQISGPAIITLYDINGKLLLKSQFAAGTGSIDVGHYAKGMYVVQDGSQSLKFIIR